MLTDYQLTVQATPEVFDLIWDIMPLFLSFFIKYVWIICFRLLQLTITYSMSQKMHKMKQNVGSDDAQKAVSFKEDISDPVYNADDVERWKSIETSPL